jgi:hypothetical protein
MGDRTDDTRKLLKLFGITVTEYEERMRTLMERRRQGPLPPDQEEDIRREAAQRTADLHKALREITNHVYQLQSDALMELVAKAPEDHLQA